MNNNDLPIMLKNDVELLHILDDGRHIIRYKKANGEYNQIAWSAGPVEGVDNNVTDVEGVKALNTLLDYLGK